MLRKIYSTLSIGLLIWLFSWTYQSCNFLDIDQYITDMQSLDSVFQKKETTRRYLYNVYSYLVNPGTSWESRYPYVLVSDEAFGTLRGSGYNYNYFANNEMDVNSGYYENWKNYYQGIRAASVFLKRVYECKDLGSIELKESIGEAQFLRAYFYFELMKQYGPVCIVPDEGFALDMPIEQILIPRSTWDECVTFVAGELEKAAANLPELVRSSSDFGKPTAGAAKAVLSRLLLYNASELFNGNTSYADFVNKKTGVPYFNPEYQEEKWAKAALAAKSVIDEGNYSLYAMPADEHTLPLPVGVTTDPNFYNTYPDGAAGIDHYKSYADVFNGTLSASDNSELIFGMPKMTIDKYMAPFKMVGWSYYNIPQKLVDAYRMVDGATIDNANPKYPYTEDKLAASIYFSGYQLKSGVHGWFLNREMRFYATVGFSGSYYIGSSSPNPADYANFQAEFFKGGNSDKTHKGVVTSNANIYCMTGYVCRKFQHPEDNYEYYGIIKPKVWIEYRLAEIYLNYVEALNMLTKAYDVDGTSISRDQEEIKKYFNLIRYRAGLPGITNNEASDQNKMKELIKQERQVELAWEGHRYFDVRRWKIADVEENSPIYGLNVNRGENDGFYRVVEVKEVSYAYRAFSRRKNFWPIPQSEVIKNDRLDQNPGW